MKLINSSVTHIKKILHLSDIHVRLVKRNQEFREVFNTVLATFAKQDLSESVIVVTGDLIHTKLEISAEMIDLVSFLLSGLADLAPTFVIAGNHDFSVKNTARLDALTPIIHNIKHSNLHYLRESGWYNVANVDFAVMSLFGDRVEWPSIHDNTSANTKIALFHGPVYGATTDVGYTITDKHVTVETFDGFQISMLGDIHKVQYLQEYSATSTGMLNESSSMAPARPPPAPRS